MGLMLPRFSMAVPQHNLAATPALAALGTQISAHATPHTKGNWATVIAATNFDVCGLTMCFVNNSTATAQVNNLIDIGIGAAASEQVLVPNIISCTSGTTASVFTLFLPLFIPKGTRIAARIQSNVTAKTSQVALFCHGGASSPPWPTFQGVVDIGTDTATSSGFAHTAGSTGTESTWTNIGSTLSRDIKAVMPMVSMDNDTNMTTVAYHMEVGYSSVALGEYYFSTAAAECINSLFPNIPLYCFIPSGTQMMIRAECSTTAESLQYALYGLF